MSRQDVHMMEELEVASIETTIRLLEKTMNSEVAQPLFERFTLCDRSIARVAARRLNDDEMNLLEPSSAERIHKKINELRAQLRKIIASNEAAASSSKEKVNNQLDEISSSDIAVNFVSKIQKQKYFVELIQALKCDYVMCVEEAELRYDHLTKLYDLFFSNQTEIVAKAEGDFLRNQQDYSIKIQREVLALQVALKKINSGGGGIRAEPVGLVRGTPGPIIPSKSTQ